MLAKILVENQNGFDNYTSSLSCAIITIAAAYALLGLVSSEFDRQNSASVLWILTGFLIYFSGNLVLFAISSTIILRAWTIHNILAMIANICYSGGFLSLHRA